MLSATHHPPPPRRAPRTCADEARLRACVRGDTKRKKIARPWWRWTGRQEVAAGGAAGARVGAACAHRSGGQLHARSRDCRLSAVWAGADWGVRRMMKPSRTLALATLWLPSRTACSERGAIKPAAMLRRGRGSQAEIIGTRFRCRRLRVCNNRS